MCICLHCRRLKWSWPDKVDLVNLVFPTELIQPEVDIVQSNHPSFVILGKNNPKPVAELRL